ncbi:MAG: hypothetical protein JOY71_18100 [Acetobacteraceae bacterium]|nr:hypothetical protein [Acetobacteraceae bacterium]MBV8524007.1 hypothetical protein [Acetobacteraceae bacterium]
MNRDPKQQQPILCPSAEPDMEGARIFGVQTGNPDQGFRVGYLTEAQPVTPDILAASGDVKPTQVLRVAAHCMGNGCKHFDGHDCKLAARIVSMLDPVVSGLPRCAIRPTCRWFRQEGRAACLRCPQMVTDLADGTGLQQQVAGDLPRHGEPRALPS